jgi:hypothetical protein
MGTSIQATLVRENQRMSFLPKYFGKRMMVAEQGIFNTLRNLCSGYNGGFWNYYELSNGGFYMTPYLDENLEMFVAGNGYEGTLSADAAGIIASLYVVNELCWADQSEKMINHYYQLRDFAAEHAESSEIFSAID